MTRGKTGTCGGADSGLPPATFSPANPSLTHSMRPTSQSSPIPFLRRPSLSRSFRDLTSDQLFAIRLFAMGLFSLVCNFSSFQSNEKLFNVGGCDQFSFIHILWLSHHASHILGTSVEFVHPPTQHSRWRYRRCPFPSTFMIM